jgi:NADPH-dependent 2,4-dienoyl-CoA reductase/sulfur reductase-like enzyme
VSGEAILIVGGGPAGLSCARSYRDHGGSRPVSILGEDAHPPFERPALSKGLIRGEVSAGSLALEPPSFYADRDIKLRVGVRVASFSPSAAVARTADGVDMPYSSLVLASGSRPLVPDLPGAQEDPVLSIRSIGDAERLAAVAEGSDVLIVGSGFIGCELAASLAPRARRVQLATAERVPHEARLGRDVGALISEWLEEDGVELIPDVELESVSGTGPVVVTLSGRELEVDYVVLAMGIRRNSELARAARIQLDGDAVPADDRLRTERPGVLAAGDVVAARNATLGRPLTVEHWGDAIEQGELAGRILAGDEEARWDGVPGFWSTIGERTIKQASWGEPHDEVELDRVDDEAFVASYRRRGRLVGVLTHRCDDAYEHARHDLIDEAAA